MSGYDRDSDPRTWSRVRRAEYLSAIGLPLLDYPGEVSEYNGVLIHWTSTLDERITLVIDALPNPQRDRLHSAFAHKGGCSFAWRGHPPIGLREGDGVEVVDSRGEAQDYWVVDHSYSLTTLAEEQIAELRTMPYEEYLTTEHWQSLRTRALEHYGGTCVLCNTQPVQVHHRTYARRSEEELTDLIVLCAACHASYHRRAS